MERKPLSSPLSGFFDICNTSSWRRLLLADGNVLELEGQSLELSCFLVIFEIFIWAKQISVAGNVEILVTGIIQITVLALNAEVRMLDIVFHLVHVGELHLYTLVYQGCSGFFEFPYFSCGMSRDSGYSYKSSMT